MQLGNKLYINSLRLQDSGIYKCFRKGGKFDLIKLKIYSPEKMFYYKIDTYLKSNKIPIDYNQVSYQACTGETNGKQLTIEWFDKNGKVIFIL